LRLKGLVFYNFFYYSLSSIVVSFFPVYFSSKGFNTSQIGILLGLGTFISIIAPPFWGFLADRYKTTKKILLFTLVGALLIGFVQFKINLFYVLLIVFAVFNWFMAPVGPLSDSLTFRITTEASQSFGSIRLFGSLGFALTALLSGWILGHFGFGATGNVFLFYGIIALLGCVFLRDTTVSNKKITLTGLRQLFQHREYVRFLVLVLILSIPHRINDGFLGVYVQSLGGSTELVGLSWFFATVSEAVFMGFSFRYLRDEKELVLIAVAALAYCVRWALTAMLGNAVSVAYLQLFHGLTFAVYYLAAFHYIDKIIPEEWKATGQSIFAAVFFGLAGMIGSILGGWVFDRYGGHTLYTSMIVISAVGFILTLLTIRYRKRECST
jgi:MFS transporter, PPP family, 3-phenylpropionic acid transporter